MPFTLPAAIALPIVTGFLLAGPVLGFLVAGMVAVAIVFVAIRMEPRPSRRHAVSHDAGDRAVRRAAVSAGSARCTPAPIARSSSTTNRQPVVASNATSSSAPRNPPETAAPAGDAPVPPAPATPHQSRSRPTLP